MKMPWHDSSVFAHSILHARARPDATACKGVGCAHVLNKYGVLHFATLVHERTFPVGMWQLVIPTRQNCLLTLMSGI